MSANSILIEAEHLVHGPKEADYGHPSEDFARTVAIINILLANKLRAPLTAEDFPMIMMACKLVREAHKHKRDNLVDIGGYAETRARILEGR